MRCWGELVKQDCWHLWTLARTCTVTVGMRVGPLHGSQHKRVLRIWPTLVLRSIVGCGESDAGC